MLKMTGVILLMLFDRSKIILMSIKWGSETRYFRGNDTSGRWEKVEE